MTRAPSGYPISDYDANGLAFPIPVLTATEVVRCRTAVDELEETLGGKPPAVELGQTHLNFSWAYELATRPSILDAVEKVLGSNLIVWSTSIFTKYPRDPGFISWHQDGTYWGLDSEKVVTAWIALSDSTVENGCMRIVPGTQREPIHPHKDTFAANNQLSRGQEIQADVDEKDAVDVVLKAGEMSLHHVNIIHGSNSNPTETKRIGYVVRFITPDVSQVGETQPVILARGVDDHGHFDLMKSPPSATPDEALAAHRETARNMLALLRKTKGAY